ncbi:MAG: bifunctional phosphoribosylaminoimidazolecarboxamide formyltransferase/IMP cyclohydrolase [Acaryochloridaceae cyanobacterium SU_2_1]|nr:bifunctional phosphoribosylaminoimidazolecarboxamide formyltransferase/IMP cyclohydrolase [Acaryochloridaceae cyanobacterium SU_2_1]
MTPLALLSTSDKTGLVALAQQLVHDFGFGLLSSGGTAAVLEQAGLPVTKVSDYTGSPEILGGRVKTLHPRIHGGILARPTVEADRQDLLAQDIQNIELVVVNLYPFEQTVAQQQAQGIPNSEVALAAAIEEIDIGGPTLIRAAAKNFAHVTVLCGADQYDGYLQQLRQGEVSLAFRQTCALQVFERTAAYDQAIATYLGAALEPGSPPLASQLTLAGTAKQTLRYGENPHQSARWYQSPGLASGWAAAQQLQGKELSYNNLVDLEAARQLMAEFAQPEARPTVAILKHNNPCGVAQADTLLAAYEKALAADPVSAFGGIVVFNQSLDQATAQQLTNIFLECIVAPGCQPEAAACLQAKPKLRLLVMQDLAQGPPITVKAIAGGWLAQTADQSLTPPADWQIVTQVQPSAAQLAELLFAWKIVKHVKSNAIVITQDHRTVGVGAGQMNRVGSVQIALQQAGEQAQGATLASDGFFPFADSVQTAAAAGITAIIQPGGSIRDQDSIAAANECGMVMAFTGTRHFLH